MQKLIDKLEEELFNMDTKPLFVIASMIRKKNIEYIEMLKANQVDGISGSHNPRIEDYNLVAAPIIAFDRNLSPEVPVVSSDNYAGGVLVAETLSKTGHKVSWLQGMTILIPQLRSSPCWLCFCLPEAQIINVSSDYSPIRKESKSVILTLKTGCHLCIDDLTALFWWWKSLTNSGLPFQKTWKIVAMTGPTLSVFPRLTTIKQPLQRIARLTVDLTKKIEGKDVKTTGYFLLLVFTRQKMFKGGRNRYSLEFGSSYHLARC